MNILKQKLHVYLFIWLVYFNLCSWKTWLDVKQGFTFCKRFLYILDDLWNTLLFSSIFELSSLSLITFLFFTRLLAPSEYSDSGLLFFSKLKVSLNSFVNTFSLWKPLESGLINIVLSSSNALIALFFWVKDFKVFVPYL